MDDANEYDFIGGDTTTSHNPLRVRIELTDRDTLTILDTVESPNSLSPSAIISPLKIVARDFPDA
jgi:hypothetical protein